MPQYGLCVKNHKLIYIPIPKAANTSIRIALFHLCDCTPRELERAFNSPYMFMKLPRLHKGKIYKPKFDNFFKFTVVRHPLDRLVSCYENKIVKSFFPRFANFKMKANMPFPEFVKRVCTTPDGNADEHFQSQARQLKQGNPRNKIELGKIYKYESLSDAWRDMRLRYPELPELPHRGKSLRKPWPTYYTPELAEMVYERFRDDFMELKYCWPLAQIKISAAHK